MPAKQFLDTNILLYAYDLNAGEKREKAAAIVGEALISPAGTAISVQVLQEFFVNFIRSGQTAETAARLIDDFSSWTIVPNTFSLFKDGLHLQARWQLSLWDSMILAAAHRSGASTLITEDLNHGQNYGSATAKNPFL
ncbi:MAG: putative nucleic acid-binding protein [Akkermansiaceae bacterium]|jgi:predicted nucleic acid-binding protein